MRLFTAVLLVATATALLSGCATVQQYPSMGTTGGGRLVLFDHRVGTPMMPGASVAPTAPRAKSPVAVR